MPKLIDHAQRREELAEATWRVIMREGVSGVSIRTVAAEAQVSTGSLRHIFATKVELLVYAMQLVDRRAGARIDTHLTEQDPRRLVRAVIGELLPLDAQRRAEMEVNVALIAESPRDSRITAVRDDAYRTLRDASVRMIDHLRRNGVARPDLDVQLEAVRLHALIDGLALHLIVDDSEAFRQQALRVVDAHLDSLGSPT